MTKNLVIVESPAKAKTIEKILGKDYLVKSCNGHVRDLSKKDISIEIENNFKPIYSIMPEKKTIIQDLQKLTKEVDKVWLATDEDREGEAISWHLAEALKIKIDNVERITFHEITKDAILKAVNNPRKINKDLVDAQQARRVLDRIVGYELSPLLWKKVKPSLSAGRVQSVAVKLIVEREEEINSFTKSFDYKVVAVFNIANKDEKKQIKAALNHKFTNLESAYKFLETCIDHKFNILEIDKKPSTKSPSPPFTTSTLQQEASRKLGFPVAKTMIVAQQLYETGKISYMRTDSVNLSDTAIKLCKTEIEKTYGKEYSQTRKYVTKTKGAQEAHEAIRPTNMKEHEVDGTKDQKRLYDLIYKRTLASQMSNAIFEKTNITISSPEKKYKFVAIGEQMKFDGFLKIYNESFDDENLDEETTILPIVNVDDKLIYIEINAIQKFAQAPARYTEANLVKKLEELGIGRPSTYAPTISTILKREYVVKDTRNGTQREYSKISLNSGKITEHKLSEIVGAEKNKLFPSDLGILVISFLKEYFSNVIDYQFTAQVEKQFDEIAIGQQQWNVMISKFYQEFHPQVVKTNDESKKFIGTRILGTDPKSGLQVSVKVGKYGPLVQIGETSSESKPKFASLLKNQSIHTISLEEALKLFTFPFVLGKIEEKEVMVSVGPYGPYIKFDGKFYQIPKTINPLEINLNEAAEIIVSKNQSSTSSIIKEFTDELSLRKGKWGLYIKFKNDNYKIPKGTNTDLLTLEECKSIINQSSEVPKKKKKVSKKNN